MAVIPSFRNLRTVLQSVIFVPVATAFFFNMIPLFLTAWENANRLQDRFQDTFRGRQNMYDFIVVGGGTAGAIVANRLSEYYSVLLLEAGGAENPLQLVPALTMNFLNQPQTDWSYKTSPQRRACLNSISQQGSLSAGRALGGSSTLDYMAFMRGHPVDFDNWALITGDRSWSYAEVLPFFRRTEEFIGSTTDTNARGGDGELRVRSPDFEGLGQEWISAGAELGYSNIDFNGRYTEGFGMLQYPLRRGMRQSTARAFLRPISFGPRLRVLPHALVTRILFRDMSNMAYGVEYERFGRTDLAIATREVILSAGTIGSPKLLMLSGIGPRQHLEETGIPVRMDLPVGRNLQDHLGVQLGPFYTTSTKPYLQDRDITPENIVRWIVKARGPLTTTGLQGAATISSTVARSRGEQNWPDIQLLLQGQGVHRSYPEQFARAHNIQEDEMVNYYENAVGRDSFHIQVIGARPTSTGSVLLASANARDPAIINPRYLEDNGDGDIRILAEGIQTALRLVENTTTFRNIGAEFTQTKLPGCETFEMRSASYWECYVRRFTMSMHNPVGTASMGAVVDSNLKVRGTRGLRVIDASIMPTIVSVGTAASTMMIAEKGSDAILREYGASPSNRGIADAVFGRNGVIVRNPVQRFISREFDRINPLPMLFRAPLNATRNFIADFNPFTRFLGIFGQGGGGASGGTGGILGIGSLFSLLNPLRNLGDNNNNNNNNNNNRPLPLFGRLFGGGNNNNNNNNIFGTNAGTNSGRSNNITPTSVLQQLFPQRNQTNTNTNPIQNLISSVTGNTNSNNNSSRNNNNSLFDILFPARNNGAGQVQSIFRSQNQNTNIFGNLFAPRNNSINSAVGRPFPSLFGGSASASSGSVTTTTNASISNTQQSIFHQMFPPSTPSVSNNNNANNNQNAIIENSPVSPAINNLLATMFGNQLEKTKVASNNNEVNNGTVKNDVKASPVVNNAPDLGKLLTTMFGSQIEEEIANRTARAAITVDKDRLEDIQSVFNYTANKFGELLKSPSNINNYQNINENYS